MTALVRYTAAHLMHSQRYLPPLLLYFVLMAILTSGDSGPLIPLYAGCAAAVLAWATWFTASVVNLEDPVSRAILVVNAGSSRKVLHAAVVVALGASVVITAFSIGFPLVTGSHTVTATDLAIGAEGQLTCAFVGIAIGQICSRLVIRRAGIALLAALTLVVFAIVQRWAVPVHPLLVLMEGSKPTADIALDGAGYAAIAVVLLIAATLATHFISDRRD
ncbi:MAG TPA: hypothetical protein VGM10_00340 [Actinocrinis sp.]|jgi:hypothetical protein